MAGVRLGLMNALLSRDYPVPPWLSKYPNQSLGYLDRVSDLVTAILLRIQFLVRCRKRRLWSPVDLD